MKKFFLLLILMFSFSSAGYIMSMGDGDYITPNGGSIMNMGGGDYIVNDGDDSY